MDILSNLPFFIAIGAGIAFLLFALINALVVAVLKRMEDPDPYFTVLPGGHDAAAADPAYGALNEWATTNDFVEDIVVEFDGIPIGDAAMRIVVWKSAYRKTFLAAYFVEQKSYQEFVTVLTVDGMLTTSNTRDSATLPPAPGFHVQALDGLDMNTLLQRHEAALVQLYEKRAIAPEESPLDTGTLIKETLRRQASYIKTLSLWQFRGVYWNFVRKYLYSNRTIT